MCEVGRLLGRRQLQERLRDWPGISRGNFLGAIFSFSPIYERKKIFEVLPFK